jgi:hypothetical protein
VVVIPNVSFFLTASCLVAAQKYRYFTTSGSQVEEIIVMFRWYAITLPRCHPIMFESIYSPQCWHSGMVRYMLRVGVGSYWYQEATKQQSRSNCGTSSAVRQWLTPAVALNLARLRIHRTPSSYFLCKPTYVMMFEFYYLGSYLGCRIFNLLFEFHMQYVV